MTIPPPQPLGPEHDVVAVDVLNGSGIVILIVTGVAPVA